MSANAWCALLLGFTVALWVFWLAPKQTGPLPVHVFGGSEWDNN